ncbi:MAG: hypothetical protein N4A76_14130 [Firmicutes bacterium]|jgi:hypothetical protein|nr:hypothetical protein [Bacillota bacterium]
MFRLWGKIYKNNDIIRDKVFVLDNSGLSLEDKTNEGLVSLCYDFDIQKPMWLNDNDKDYDMVGKTAFNSHHFIESIDFDYFEIEIIEDDE